MKNLSTILQSISNWHSAGKDTAIATLVQSSGSSPLPVGEMMAISSSFDMVGAVSRGCVESAILETAQQAMQENKAVLTHYGYSNQSAFEVGLTCGGEIDVLIEPVLSSQHSTSFLQEALAKCDLDDPFFWLHPLDENGLGKKILCDATHILYSDEPIEPSFEDAILAHLNQGSPAAIVNLSLERDRITPVFIQAFQAMCRLIIIGAGEISIYLTKMAKILGFKVIVIDPRSMFASTIRFPEADTVLAKWPQDCMKELVLRAPDYLVVISHDEKIDLPALQIGLASDVGYIGLLGSLKTRQSRFDALLEAGWETTDLTRIHAPIGINIHSRKAEEIAVSILAEIIQVTNQA
ncbi:MAG TPA: hypothetical protein DCK95_01415 [Anaerolineaceae bacterium]|uniref:Xanthine dehydrogenase n=1 Tax=Anaerolinea thermophila TaxID=167964 RepID=A0A124FN44_9CHLR|nr:MAG: hypothetical protein XD73_0373 [Anaerolinea thermophila]HAF60967.1 hypothetical protein [Anaerolineaceae bacterium]